MDRNQKEASVEELNGIFDASGSVVMAHYSGMTVAEMTELRAKLRELGGTFKVVRNRLAKIALKGKPGEGAADLFTGPVAIAYSEDFVAAPKVAVDYAKDNDKFVILGGFMEEEVFDAKGIEALSKLPSREELIGTIAARLLGQASQIGQRLAAPGQGLAGAIEVIREKAEA
ncbi:MAG: 50S ribosomal protein L10 [Maricaulis sp.]|uniref:50S ribosomal protein L10 n=1 Tax=Maricaulis sp. TaxID=1486257 RepID=UPI001B1CF89D|nr:50S ribosomal protein L10 [Maricaulis sp.]MBO6729727.1 50S ribosomal protein L10 [Maricaulis sp.]MBO6848722.1 50S ribosomal protein L10 [Maricaulis sp.]MBO6878691.1 50S ribosomal protein L10 [Maricaulis sp.]